MLIVPSVGDAVLVLDMLVTALVAECEARWPRVMASYVIRDGACECGGPYSRAILDHYAPRTGPFTVDVTVSLFRGEGCSKHALRWGFSVLRKGFGVSLFIPARPDVPRGDDA